MDNSFDKKTKNISFCCCGCAEQFVKLINLCISTAYSNRFLQEITGKDESMRHVSDLLGSISKALHILGAEMSEHILNEEPHLNHFKIFDPKYPSWKGDPAKFVLEGNKVVVVAIEHFLLLMKVHDHHVERNLLKKLIRRTKLIFLWDELEKLLMTEIEKDSVLQNDSQRVLHKVESEEEIKNEDQSTRAMGEDLSIEGEDRLPVKIKAEPSNLSEEPENAKDKKFTSTSEEETKPTIPFEASQNIQETFKDRAQIKDWASQVSEDDILRELDVSDGSFDPKVTSSTVKETEVEKGKPKHSPSSLENISLMGERVKESDFEESLPLTEGDGKESEDSLSKDKISLNVGPEELSDSENYVEKNVDKMTNFGGDLMDSVFFLVFDVPIQSNTRTVTDAEVELFNQAANWLLAHGAIVRVPKNYLGSKFLKNLRDDDKMAVWNGVPWEMPEEIDFIISVGDSGNFDHSSLEFGKEIPPVIKLDTKENQHVDNPMDPLELKRKIFEKRMELRRMRLGLSLQTLGELTILRTAMNEVTLMKFHPQNSLKLRVVVDNFLLDELEAEGLVIASPTGSNRYNKKFGGPLVSPGLECIIITPMTKRRRSPFIVSPRSRVTVSLTEDSPSVCVEFDGNYVGTLDKDGRLQVRAADFWLEEIIDKNDSEIRMLKSMKNHV